MDQRLEQFQKEMQDQVQAQVQEQLAKIQQDMMESQRDMSSQITQMTQLLNGFMERGKGPMAITGVENEDIPSRSTLPQVPSQHEEYPRRPSVTIRPQQGQANIGSPMNFQVGSGSNPGDDPINPMVPDFDEMEKERMKAEPSRKMEDRYRWLEERVKVIEKTETLCGIDIKELSLVPNLVLPPKFKTPDFEKYNGTSCPGAHLKMFSRRMAGHANNEKILIHCFQDSLVGSAAKWYDRLSSTQIKTWRDLAQAFMKHYGHIADIASDRVTLQTMEKRPSENFRQYAQRWREVATQVQPPLLEEETATLFIHTLKAPFINHMLGSSMIDFSEIVRCGERIEHAVRCGKIEAGEGPRKTALKKREGDVNNMSARDKSVTLNQPSTVITDRPSSHKHESNTKPNGEKLQFTPIYMTYGQLYQKLYDTHVVAPHYLQPLQPP
ncbi:Gag-pro-like protein [Gossypium australe]|uniref:Gag-pro-like protein n=1 Tax=Gossypium australe TaxID=47621 RepID=A0A5B6WEQ8_9ROSI|nr:Gag-pro-like protein [Gossypium australe]